jgi:hypothetical protein
LTVLMTIAITWCSNWSSFSHVHWAYREFL